MRPSENMLNVFIKSQTRRTVTGTARLSHFSAGLGATGQKQGSLLSSL